MRVGIFVVSATLAGAGAAFAQSDWVVDPWAVTAPNAASSAIRSAIRTSSRIAAPVEWIDERNFELADPWLSPTQSPPGTSSGARPAGAPAGPRPPRASGERGDWAKPVPLLVDPWAQDAPKARVPASDFIVDPWAADVYGR